MSGQSHHDFDALHRFIRRHLDRLSHDDRIDAIRRNVDLLERGIDAKIPSVWTRAQIDIIRRELLRIEEEL